MQEILPPSGHTQLSGGSVAGGRIDHCVAQLLQCLLGAWVVYSHSVHVHIEAAQ